MCDPLFCWVQIAVYCYHVGGLFVPTILILIPVRTMPLSITHLIRSPAGYETARIGLSPEPESHNG
ncbi:hypothetical protein BDV38DRAFT_244131 [Aspergillus pseudotamarii]|uniref:Uncharacterized protein n=1 Tax=Aspergillus pseudotamarii TaxID=132259 RepID=A0A5N6SXH2_ASPPS|nr:uncharacterized protein BDV38DRAFT_244131 [Aspergillus pseudotamarii]KAE8138607.1 hypothetical protein BDV38DRAFT_244131 [Aspergillus pseudotamarii]